MNDTDLYYDNDGGEDDDFGLPVIAVFPFPELSDYERLLLSLSMEQAKMVLIRHFGIKGKKAAQIAGLPSEWALYRRENELHFLMERKREEYLG
jgi:hypothetical protein